jgi:hypothetical protein
MSISDEMFNALTSVASLCFISLYFRIILQVLGQTWIKTIAHTSTLVLLPILTFVITKVISGNIALSLGMVGALSIVRFRNPVRSPLELSVYFGAITLGIAASVSDKWAILLVVSITFASIFLFLVHLLAKLILSKPFFIASFAEGNTLTTLQVSTTNRIDFLEASDFLMSKVADENGINYSLASENFEKLKKLDLKVSSIEQVFYVQLNR